MSYDWKQTERFLDNIKPVEGGFTKAKRGIIELPEGKVFVKIGVDETTNNWIKREIQIYQILQKHKYSHCPQLVSVKDDLTAFAIEAKDKSEGWDWTNNWSPERLSRTLEAMDDFALLVPDSVEKDFFSSDNGLENENGWEAIVTDSNLKMIVLDRVRSLGSDTIVSLSQLNSEYVFDKTALVHNDVRADNCAWNKSRNEVALVDWNWAQLGDRRIDVNAVLVDVAMSGLDVASFQKNRLDKNALIWLAGFWLKSASAKISASSNLSSLIDFQIRSGITALELSTKI